MKIVRVTVEGGVIQNITCPEGVKAVVRDYDTGGIEDAVKQDESGDDYIETIWEERHPRFGITNR